ncbi:NAD(P)/FAD-dependent oxidoreductase [Altibacter sp.]|uniref:NAD(P)/FAD-dependent oxidoreductase n=1 Tax=Altibacter sp. TaxID=2024823 RepID=UPI000C933287|nr:NAD(P)/FAD-dependent oxidoreductase [Altibacter sp.]MAP53827.1 FAD-dependent oxidoreductase [Altibacter sp.]
MTHDTTWEVLIIGGGLAGLTAALHLSRTGRQVLVIEKYGYPHHKVCGEYISNEVLPYLNRLGIDPFAIEAKSISKFQISTKNGHTLETELPQGGFGISRFAFDALLYEHVLKQATVAFDTVENLSFDDNVFDVRTQNGNAYKASFVLGAFGKRSNLDGLLDRPFMKQKSPWLAVKAHYNYAFPEDTVALHNFEGGYCGLSMTETNVVNACYLTTFRSFKRFKTIPDFQKEVMSENPHIKKFFTEAELVFEKPLAISQISFQSKQPVENHIFMIGDSAGLIHPLCGNGMAMAIHAAKIFSELYLDYTKTKQTDRTVLENAYRSAWQTAFSKRLRTGRRIQSMLLQPIVSRMGFKVATTFPRLVPALIQQTHGEPF